MELDKADELVNVAYRRVRNLDRFSRSAPIGKAEFAIIVLQALAELSALADWTLGPGMMDSIIERLDDNEREKFEKFHEFVRRAGEEARIAAGQSSLMGNLSGSAARVLEEYGVETIGDLPEDVQVELARELRAPAGVDATEPTVWEIDPAPLSHSRRATHEEVFGDEDLGTRAAEAIVYQLYYEIVERAVILVERSAAARTRLWPLVWVVATLIPPPDLSLRRRGGAPDSSGP